MARTITLDDEQEDLLRFVVDATLEEWVGHAPEAIDFAASDPMHSSLEEMLEAAADIPRLNTVLKEIRRLLT